MPIPNNDGPTVGDRGNIERIESRLPDPGLVTVQQLIRETTTLKEVVFTRLDGMDRAIVVFQENLTRVPTDVDKQVGGLKELVNERFKVVDEQIQSIDTQFEERDVRAEQTSRDNRIAIDAALQAAKEAAAAIDEKTAHLQALHDEKFRSIATQFQERDVRSEQTSRDSKVAVDAALQAAKEAVGEQNRSSALAIAKSEAATLKQIDQLVLLQQTAAGALNDKIDDIKERLTIIEGKTLGAAAQHHSTQGAQIQWVGIIMAVVGIAGAVVGLTLALASDPPPVVERVIVAPPSEGDDF